MKITIKSPVLFSSPTPRTVHVLEITPCNVPYRAGLEREAAQVILDWLFRQFNRVDGNELITVFDLKMPSLSVGDEVELEGLGTWRCAAVGWEKIA
jgi:hypothetical protein